jgi:hypothetical protein
VLQQLLHDEDLRGLPLQPAEVRRAVHQQHAAAAWRDGWRGGRGRACTSTQLTPVPCCAVSACAAGCRLVAPFPPSRIQSSTGECARQRALGTTHTHTCKHTTTTTTHTGTPLLPCSSSCRSGPSRGCPPSRCSCRPPAALHRGRRRHGPTPRQLRWLAGGRGMSSRCAGLRAAG